MRALVTAFGLWVASGVLFGIALFATAVVSGRTVAAGERAVTGVAVFDVLVALAAVVLFAGLTKTLSGLSRGLAVAGFAVIEVAILVIALVMTLLGFNR
jgi:hypothetical protein